MLVPTITVVALLQIHEKPIALRAMEEARRCIVSGHVEFSVVQSRRPNVSLNYRARYARNGDRILEEKGDDHGWTRFQRDPGGSADRGYSRLPTHYMHNQQGYWTWLATTTHGNLWKTADPATCTWKQEAKDIRKLGTYVDGRELHDGSAPIWAVDDEQTRIIRWTEERQGAEYIVSGSTELGSRFVWTINSLKGWNPERVELHAPIDGRDTLIAECESELRDFGGTWFPERTTYRRRGDALLTITIHSAAFNAPNDATRFTGADLGLEPGFSISPQDFEGPTWHGVRRGLRWSGSELVEAHQWDEMLKKGAKRGPTLERVLRGESSPLLTDDQRALLRLRRKESSRRLVTNQHETLWANYVRWFENHYHLDQEQCQQAELILADCQQQAQNYLDKKKSDIENLFGRELTELAPQEASALEQRQAELLTPIQSIFKEDLKPRLDRLPTRKQRLAADLPAGSTTGAASAPSVPGALEKKE